MRSRPPHALLPCPTMPPRPSARPSADSKDFNRATAESALRFAEDQVFQPERDEFDFLMNRKVLADMGIRFWRFRPLCQGSCRLELRRSPQGATS